MQVKVETVPGASTHSAQHIEHRLELLHFQIVYYTQRASRKLKTAQDKTAKGKARRKPKDKTK